MLPKYKAISFVGYNYATEEDMDRVYDYVTNGGTAILSWPHLSVTTNRTDVENNVFEIIDHKLVDHISKGRPVFEKDTIRGNEIEICNNLSEGAVVLGTTDSGSPLKIQLRLGNGNIILVNAKAYPHNKAICDIYKETVINMQNALISEEPSWIECGDDVEFTVYECENGSRNIYVLAVDWYNDPTTMRHFILCVGDFKYNIEIPFGTMLKIAVSGNKAVFSYNEDAELNFINDRTLNVQGIGDIDLFIASDNVISKKALSFNESPVIDVII